MANVLAARGLVLAGGLPLLMAAWPGCTGVKTEAGAEAAPDRQAPGATDLWIPLPPQPEPRLYTEDQVEDQARLGLMVLRARAVSDQLRGMSSLGAAQPRCTMGEAVEMRLELRNELDRDLVLLQGPSGIVLEFRWELARWAPFGSREGEASTRAALLPGDLALAPGESYVHSFTWQLDADDGVSAVWDARLGVRLRCAGARLGEEELPVSEVAVPAARFLALPDGWPALAADPLAGLDRACRIGAAAADRHVLVSAALLAPEQRPQGLRLLAEGLPAAPNPERARTMITALQWLTGLDLGDAPAAWISWWQQQPDQP